MTTLEDVFQVPGGLFIDDEWVPPSKGRAVPHVNPATGAVQAEVAAGDVDDVDRAVTAARRALGQWKRWKPADRRRALMRVADLMRTQSQRLIAVSALESGIPVLAGTEIVKMGVEWAETAATWADKLSGEVVPTDPATFDYVLTEPIGVVGVIMTWNGPAASLGISVMPALAAGCCVVVKPSELAPFSSLMFAELCREAGIPAGVVSVVPGDAVTGAALVEHPGVDKVSFTGGVATSRRIAEVCARRGVPVLLELGGKSANIVFDDADLAKAKRSALGVLALSGQGCIVPSRLLVQDSIYDEFVASVVKTFGRMPLGDPLAPTTAIGPVISEAATTRILGFVERAKSANAGTLLTGGERMGGDLAAGFYIAPTVFGDVDNSSELAQEEIFGPVLAIARFGDEEDAVALANDSRYGLSGYVHTKDLGRAVRVASALDVGTVGVNGGPGMGGPEAPFGGVKQSGYGREGGKAGVLEFVRTKNVIVDLT